MKKIVSISVLSFLLLSIAPQASLAQISNQELPSKNKTERIENQKKKKRWEYHTVVSDKKRHKGKVGSNRDKETKQ